MPGAIAVYLGSNGETAALNEPGRVVIYQKEREGWEVRQSLGFEPGEGIGLRELRGRIAEMVALLSDCKIFVGSVVTGVLFYSLEKAGCSVWEFTGKPEEFLDYVLEKEEAAAAERAAAERAADSPGSTVIPLPEEVSAGCFRINLKEVQENHSGITSKQVLVPFLKKGKFYSLEIRCTHVPPWLEAEMLNGSLTGSAQQLGPNDYLMTVTKKCCHEMPAN